MDGEGAVLSSGCSPSAWHFSLCYSTKTVIYNPDVCVLTGPCIRFSFVSHVPPLSMVGPLLTVLPHCPSASTSWFPVDVRSRKFLFGLQGPSCPPDFPASALLLAKKIPPLGSLLQTEPAHIGLQRQVQRPVPAARKVHLYRADAPQFVFLHSPYSWHPCRSQHYKFILAVPNYTAGNKV